MPQAGARLLGIRGPQRIPKSPAVRGHARRRAEPIRVRAVRVRIARLAYLCAKHVASSDRIDERQEQDLVVVDAVIAADRRSAVARGIEGYANARSDVVAVAR